MKSSNEHMRPDRLEDLLYDKNKSLLKALKIEEENIRRLTLVCTQQCDWYSGEHYSKQLGHNLVARENCERHMILHEEKRNFQ